ncbi:hypothetical protein QFZ94_000335 [Paraburkholderia sp. JPY465]|uniref:hypothetical protein n=1 Tax=Paraburkholderia sp. JPY465 TaxID=3042285 RepID=UPI003D254BFE
MEFSAWFKKRDFCVTQTSGSSLRKKAGIVRNAVQMEAGDDLPISGSLRLEWAESEQRQPVIVRLAAHQFPRALSSSLRASAAGKAAMVEDKLQQTKPGPPALQMTPVGAWFKKRDFCVTQTSGSSLRKKAGRGSKLRYTLGGTLSARR